MASGRMQAQVSGPSRRGPWLVMPLVVGSLGGASSWLHRGVTALLSSR